MSDVYDSAYWNEEFNITRADLDRIEAHIRETRQAHDLTTLARRIVRGRLRHGPESSAPAQPVWAEDPSVRLWDPAGRWKVGDHVIVAYLYHSASAGRNVYEPRIGEVVAVEGGEVTMQLEGLEQPVTFRQAARGSEEARRWRDVVKEVIAEKRAAPELGEQVEAVLLTHGERIISQLLDSLRADERFVRLAGRWFLRELALPPTEEQLTALAWAMVPLEEPQPTDALAPLVQPPLAEGDPALFGLYLAMRERPDPFANADPGQRPRWALAGPPPGSFTPHRPAYDPDTYEILCLPGQPATPEIVERLWELDLLKAVI